MVFIGVYVGLNLLEIDFHLDAMAALWTKGIEKAWLPILPILPIYMIVVASP